MTRSLYPFRYSYNVHFQDGRLFAGILTSLLYLLLAISLDAAGYVQNTALLIPVSLGHRLWASRKDW